MQDEMTLTAVLERLQGVRPSSSGHVARCPAHEDREPSLSVTEKDGKVLMNCFAGCEFEDVRSALGFQKPIPTRTLTNGMHLHHGTDAQHMALGELRNVGIEAVKMGVRDGLIKFGTWHDQAVWAITDATQNNTQLRRMDGTMLKVGDGERKTHTVKGSTASWPIGIKEAHGIRDIAMVEGGPDLLAAYARIHFEDRDIDSRETCDIPVDAPPELMKLYADEFHGGVDPDDIVRPPIIARPVKPVAMLGASQSIPDIALPLFRGKNVIIYPDADRPGVTAANRWGHQIKKAGGWAMVHSFMGMLMPDGSPVKDFNDTCYCTQAEQDKQGRYILPR